MTQIIELLDKEVKSAIIKIIQQNRANTFERNGKIGCSCKEKEVINEESNQNQNFRRDQYNNENKTY